ncbi:MAG: pyruvate ferredoxin oxidoreductase [Candidatus Solincola sediminis]|uniref:Pyruvate ferredoxin oxidoreductase n=1 Tax=Candidatus Solincola sediminis TaxID=1797199 RepID=A0A1F2WIQ7_9ACTN|nr:MAG: pyruvate ferredoxin oxidoreductase [Candidatus Solincola sediminis]OFW59755.1 MAG: pyruvate ferredoxin oxidoreductase [Candidatus Solincola sediminis]
MISMLEGSKAVAEAVRLCRPNLVCAYPITPQTHIVEELARMVADGRMHAGYVLAESEFGAASIVLGGSAVGGRAYTATSSQGLLLMTEVMFNIAGLRLPVVMTCANRAVSAPINIWNDQQDAVSIRDSGWIQLFVEDNQEALDTHIQAFRIAEQLMIPVMVCMDGFVLTHTVEPVELPAQEKVDSFLPPYKPSYRLDPDDPFTMGAMVGPDAYMETRYNMHNDMMEARTLIEQVARDYEAEFGRWHGGMIETYDTEGADIVLVSMGSLLGTMRDAIDELRREGLKVGLLKIRCFRPFPMNAVHDALQGIEVVGVIEKDISLGLEGTLCSEMRSAFCGEESPDISSFVMGLGGRDIKIDEIKQVARDLANNPSCRVEFRGLNEEVVMGDER